MRTRCPSPPLRHKRFAAGFTIVEAVVALVIFGAFALGSTATLNMMDSRAAKNRNSEAARAVVDDYVNFVLAENTSMPATTGDGTDIDGDGTPDGVAFSTLDNRTLTGGVIPLIVTRTAAPISIVDGTLYWRVQTVGTAYGLAHDNDLVQIDFTMAYTFRGQTYYYKALTFKSKT